VLEKRDAMSPEERNIMTREREHVARMMKLPSQSPVLITQSLPTAVARDSVQEHDPAQDLSCLVLCTSVSGILASANSSKLSIVSEICGAWRDEGEDSGLGKSMIPLNQ